MSLTSCGICHVDACHLLALVTSTTTGGVTAAVVRSRVHSDTACLQSCAAGWGTRTGDPASGRRVPLAADPQRQVDPDQVNAQCGRTYFKEVACAIDVRLACAFPTAFRQRRLTGASRATSRRCLCLVGSLQLRRRSAIPVALCQYSAGGCACRQSGWYASCPCSVACFTCPRDRPHWPRSLASAVFCWHIVSWHPCC